MTHAPPLSVSPDWSRDARIRRRGGLLAPDRRAADIDPADMDLAGMAARCFGQIVSELDGSGQVEGLGEIPLLISRSTEVNAALLGSPHGAAVVLDLGLLRAIDDCVRHAIADPEFLSIYLPQTGSAEAAAERDGFSYSLKMHMIDFVIHHEVAHDVRDHIGILRRSHGQMDLDERLSLSSIASGDELLRFIEFDADIHALDMQLIEMHQRSPLSTWEKDELEDAVFVQILAMILICQILDRAHDPIAAHARLAHPAPVHRALFYSGSMIDSLSFHCRADRAWLDGIHDQAWYEASIVAERNSFPTGRWRGPTMDGARFDLFEKIRRRLVKFSRSLDRRDAAGDTARIG